MDERTKARAGTVVAAVLAADGLLHAYWATGGVWPARDRRMLAHLVLGRDKPAAFRPAIVAPLAGLLALGAATALARVGRLGHLGRRIPGPLRQAGTLAIAAGLAARGAAGLGMVAWGDPDTPFARLNRTVYTPACLALSVAALVAAWPIGCGGENTGEGVPPIPDATGSGQAGKPGCDDDLRRGNGRHRSPIFDSVVDLGHYRQSTTGWA